MFNSAFTLVPLLFTLSVVNAATNDWSVPCNNGRCSYDMPANTNGAAGSVTIWGSPNAIADITSAGGWTILDCDKALTEQEIRLVCKNTAECDRLDQNGGAEGKIVRLPESCGANAFARVARSWVHADQSIPEGVASKVARRQNGAAPQVRGLAIDTKFSEALPTNGEVMIAIQGSTIPGLAGNLTVTAPGALSRRSRVYARGTVSNFISGVYDSFLRLAPKEIKKSSPVKFKQSLPIFEQQLECGPVTGKIKGSAGAAVDATIAIGVGALGTLTKPAKLTDLGLTIGIDGDIEGSLTMSTNIAGKIDGKKELFSVGLPGLSFPGLFEIGPFFKIEATAEAKVDLNSEIDIGFKYRADDVRLFFPRSDRHPPKGAFNPESRPLSISLSPSLSSTASLEAHIIPKLAIGVNGLGNKADIFVDLDSKATAKATIKASAKAVINAREEQEDTRSLAVRQTVTKTPANTAETSVDGCVDVSAGLSVNVGAEASFLGLFDKENKLEFPVKNFSLFQSPGCAKVNARDVARMSMKRNALVKRLECTSTTLAGNLVAVAKNFLGKPAAVTGRI
ncbi:hypothetical protein PC9H_010573 [Pleurotus ostreatus]|uniref:DUF7223 domain-containing protein n=2 Tax=Pleurotus TaxID=5320 RepID=A0A8H6ZJZ9_PLEOS|nr:uncharacterized protein PC9H_010573 [Pleurotus ostreatus]KAF7422417.1 hypothetical protein PC9H_010573 [Pleurotus ostreatus]KAG9227698.1 hypothetical protein CCMSSC00406_0000656 [Pleurotus cornucopiae]KAJ8691745.1 hypothetical protein PTI98_011282 [Pleurotus ostreatus]